MLNSKKFVALGLMSGTSVDGLDIALLETDGNSYIKLGPTDYYPFSRLFSRKIKSVFKQKVNLKILRKKKRIVEIENEFTKLNYLAIRKFINKKRIKKKIDVIGFHGQTISHNPKLGYSWQIGSSQKLANSLNIKVVGDFRSNDIKNGGEGAPLTPIFHYFLSEKIKKRICFINLGGISNLTYFDHNLKKNLKDILAFDAGPCCSLLNDWVSKKSKKKFDKYGLLAKRGVVNEKIVNEYMKKKFFLKKPPKSLDRGFFSISPLKKMRIEDGAATLTDLIVKTLLLAFKHLPKKPDLCILSGGGRLNKFLVESLNNKINSKIILTEDCKWNGDFIEAYAFAYLSVRKLLNLPITFPRTTGTKKPLIGGNIFTSI